MNNQTKKGIIAVVSIAVLFLVVKKILKKVDANKSQLGSNQDLGNQGGGNQGGGNQGGGNQGGGNKGGGNVTLSPLDYKGMADKLFEYMDGYMTNEEKIYAILMQVRNQKDWDSIKSAYGIRKVSSGRGNIFQSDFKGDLVGALDDELDSDEFPIAKGIITSKGIRF